MPETTCSEIEARLDEAVHGRLDASLAAHVAACAACRRLVARQRRLEALLDAQPEPPAFEGQVPALPADGALRPLLRLPGLRSAAAAAAAVAIAFVAWEAGRSAAAGRGADGALLGQAGRVRIERIVDVPGALPPADERLLALTSGVEAVAMRRPTEVR